MAKTNGSNSRKRKAGAPKETGGKKRKTEIKTSKQAKTTKAVSKKDKRKNLAKVGKQKNKATAQAVVNKKDNTHVTVRKQKNGGTGTKKTPAKATKRQKKAEGTKTIPAKAAKPAKKFEFVLKEGVPKGEELEGLGMSISDKWTNLGRRLNIEEPKLRAISKDFDSVHERGFQMLKHWKQKEGSGANYKSLADALKHSLVARKDLAEKYCFKRRYSRI